MGEPLDITGLILAGGAGRRAGGQDKGLVLWRGEPLVAHVAARLRPQVDAVLISCNRNAEAYSRYAVQTVADRRAGFQGPLSGLEAAAPALSTTYVAVAACDTPLLPGDLVNRLLAVLRSSDADICCAHDGQRAHYLCAVMRTVCLSSLTPFLDSGGRAVHEWYATRSWLTVDFSDRASAFDNLNRID